jgi:hypothetical protein
MCLPGGPQLRPKRQWCAQIAAEIANSTQTPEQPPTNPTKKQNEPKSGGKACHIHGFRDESTGQFYALSLEDREAMNKHCEGIVLDINPENNRERWLATAIAEDQWRLNRARALENNIFAIGMSGPLVEATNADNPEVLAAVCQARVWLADGKSIQALSLYEQRIRRGVEKNEKQLHQMQAERKALRDQALEEAILIAEFALSKGETYDENNATEALGENGFEFSPAEIVRLARRRILLQQALQYRKQTLKHSTGTEGTRFPTRKAA